jgi:hypothetical protein
VQDIRDIVVREAMEIFVRTELDLDELAQKFREILSIPNRNQTPHRIDQDRESTNWGGLYYLFEVFGLELTLVRNRGEVEIPEWSDYPYYIAMGSDVECDTDTLTCITTYVCAVLKNAGLEAASNNQLA